MLVDSKVLAKLAREAGEQRREANAWNYDTVEVAANYAAAQAFEDFADLLDELTEEG